MLTRVLPIRPRASADPARGSAGLAAEQAMCQEEKQLACPAARLALLRADYARLVAAARASITAARAGATEPLVYVEAELARHGGLPPRDATVPGVLADVGTAMMLAAGSQASYVGELPGARTGPFSAYAVMTESGLRRE